MPPYRYFSSGEELAYQKNKVKKLEAKIEELTEYIEELTEYIDNLEKELGIN